MNYDDHIVAGLLDDLGNWLSELITPLLEFIKWVLHSIRVLSN